MAWTCSGATNDELVSNLRRKRIIHNDRVEAAMRAVDRAEFAASPHGAYMDAPQPIGYAATISAPHMHANALELMEPYLQPGNRALDVGSGKGYLTVAMAELLGPSGVAVGVEHISELVDGAIEGTRKSHADKLERGNVEFHVADGREGWPPHAPYHAIHVGAAAARIPEALIEQLAPGGRMIIPVGPAGGFQEYVQVDKEESGKVHRKSLFGVGYVPLTSAEEQRRMG